MIALFFEGIKNPIPAKVSGNIRIAIIENNTPTPLPDMAKINNNKMPSERPNDPNPMPCVNPIIGL